MNPGNPPPYPGPGPTAPYPPYPPQPMGPGAYPPGPMGGPYPPPQGYPYQGYPQYGWQGGPQEPPKTTGTGSGICVYAGVYGHSPRSPKLIFVCFLWQRRNSGLCVLWLTFPKLGDCLAWFLTPEKNFFLRRPEAFLPTYLYVFYPSGADDFLVNVFSKSTFWNTAGGKVSGGFLLSQPVVFFRFGLLRLFSLLVC
uniref:Cysteine rich transmembrane module containing 1 n=1 Tax=Canis lupus familiaris TaxID=9615 RepID=A0A8P0PN18_CANLF